MVLSITPNILLIVVLTSLITALFVFGISKMKKLNWNHTQKLISKNICHTLFYKQLKIILSSVLLWTTLCTGFIVILFLIFRDTDLFSNLLTKTLPQDSSSNTSILLTAVSIMVAMYIGLFIWSALKESDIKKFDKESLALMKEIKRLDALVKLMMNMYKVANKGGGNGMKKPYSFNELYTLPQEEIKRFSNEYWAKDDLGTAYEIRKMSREINNTTDSILDYCSLSNYMNSTIESYDKICSTSNLFPFLDELKIAKTKSSSFNSKDNRMWNIAGIRFLKKDSEEDLLNAIFCFIKSIQFDPESDFPYRFIIMGMIVTEANIERDNNNDTIWKLNKITYPTQDLKSKEIVKYILKFVSKFTKIDEETLVKKSWVEIAFEIFKLWKKRYCEKKKDTYKKSIYSSFIILFDDMFNVINNQGSDNYHYKLYEYLSMETVINQLTKNDTDKASMFNFYSRLKKKFENLSNDNNEDINDSIDNIIWNKLNLLYLTHYYYMTTDDEAADDVLLNDDDYNKGRIYNELKNHWESKRSTTPTILKECDNKDEINTDS